MLAAIHPQFDTWALAPPNKNGLRTCYTGTATSYKAVAGWSGRSLDEALCSPDQHLRDKAGMRPVGGMTAIKACSDADCCQQACCDSKATCTTWGFGTESTHTYHGCYIGKATYWEPEYGWVGASGRTLGPLNPTLAHVGSKFDGYYKLVVSSSGAVTAKNVHPCPDSQFPVSFAHYTPKGGKVKAIKDCHSVSCCQQSCRDASDCTTWGFSKLSGCVAGIPARFVYDSTFLSCASSMQDIELVAAGDDLPLLIA